jgi:signal transduction histidine kinase
VLEYAGVPGMLAPSIEITAYRIIQESITNVVRHANATRVVVEVNGGETGDELEVVVRDNGRGFDFDAYIVLQPGSMSSGLLGMSERVKLLGGIFNLEASIGIGTRIVATLPLKSIRNGTDKSIAG